MSLKKISLFCLLLPLMLCGSLRASSNCCSTSDCCYDDCCPSFCSDWGVYADYLYWNTRRADLDFAVPWDSVTLSNSMGKVSRVCPEYQSGFRVGILKDWCDLYFDFHYTYYRNCSSDTTRADNLQLAGTRFVDAFAGVTQGGFGYAKGTFELDYDTLDLLAGYRPNWCGCVDPYFFGGLKFARIDQSLKSLYSTDVNVGGNTVCVKETVDMCAYGVDLGFGASYDLWCCIGFFGEFSYDVLLGNFDRRFKYKTSTDGGMTYVDRANLCEDDCWRMISVFNYRFGFTYDNIFSNCWCADLSLAIGYEFHHWLNMSDFLDYQNESDEITFDRHIQSLGFDGLFIRAAISF